MDRIQSVPTRLSGSAARRYLLLASAVLWLIGCGPVNQTRDRTDEAVSARAETWPSYRAPIVVDPLPPGRPPKLAPLSDPGYRAVTPAWVVTPYEEWNLEKTAENSLGRIGESAVPALVRSLNHPDPVLRLRAAKILGRIGPEARSAVPQLVSTLRDPQLPVRKAAIWALGQIGPDAAEAVDPLLNVLNASATEDEPIQQTSLDRPAAGASAP